MKELIISGNDEWVKKLKAHLEKEHPSTRGKMWIKSEVEKKLVGKPIGLKAGFKTSFKNMADAGKKALDPIDDVMNKIDKQLKGFG